MLGSHLIAWRSHRNLSQAQLAEKARLPRPYLSKLERNMADPSLSVVRRLAGALDLAVGELVDTKPVVKMMNRFELEELTQRMFARDRKNRLGERAWRHLRAQIGEPQWQAVVARLQKHRWEHLPAES